MIKFPFTDSGSKGTVTDYSRSSSWYQIPEITRDVDTFFVYPTDYMAMNEVDPDFAPLDTLRWQVCMRTAPTCSFLITGRPE